MKRLLSVAVVLALAAARPETYKETEDFNYARSSTDEGSKTGFYNAQRGNMGGNYERAHNMDGLAQHQMSTAVKQVEGELGEASNMKSGQVYTSAHSGGMFGSGHYDVSNLQGRNFQENAASESQSHSSLSSHHSNYNDQLSSSMHNSGFSRNHGYGQYHGSKAGGQSLTSSNLQAIDVHDASYGYGTHGAGQLTNSNLQATDNVHGANYGSGTHATKNSHRSGYSSQSGYNSHSAYDSSNTNQHTHSGYGTIPQNRMIYTVPVRVYERPGSAVAIPLAVQNYDATHSASMVDQNAINSEAEVLNAGDQHVAYRPTSNAKHYESSYNYRKHWEKHDVKPVVIATESPLPQNSELYEDTQAANAHHHSSGLNSQSHYSSSSQNAFNTKSSSATQLHNMASLASSDAHTHGAYSSGNSAEATNALGGIDTKPKSYQSSYSYHKSWERQGDPYVIKPVGGAYTEQELQRLTAASQQTGSNYHQTHQGYSNDYGLVCCDASGYRRVARSARGDDLTQQSQINWGDKEDLGQQTQNSWDRSDALRQAQVQHAQVQQVQEPIWENLEDLGQRTQNSWDSSDAYRQARNQNKEDLGQQVQQNAWANKEDLTQQAQQNTWDNSEDLTQQAQQHKWNNAEHVGHDQRHLDQEVLHAWPEITYPEQNDNQAQDSANKPGSSEIEQKHLSEFQDKEKMTRPSSSDFNLEHRQSNSWSNQEKESQSNIWSNQEQQSQSNTWPNQEQQSESNIWSNQEQSPYNNWSNQEQTPYNIWSNQEQQSESDIWSNQEQHSQSNIWSNQEQQRQSNIWSNQEQQSQSNNWSNQEQQRQSNIWSNQEQQSQSNNWSSQEQQEMQLSSLRSHGQEEIDQQGNKPLGVSQYLDQHKYTNQQQEDVLPPAWVSIDKHGNSYHHESGSYDQQEVQQHSGTESFGIYDWSQVSANKNDTDISQSSSLLNKINELDRQLSASNNGSRHNIMSANSTVKPHKADKASIDISKITENSRVNKIKENNEDIGRGDIGPEEDFVEQNLDIQTLNESKPIALTKENNISLSIDDNNKQVTNNQQLLNQWFEEERKNSKFYNLNSTADTSQQSSLEQKYYQSGSSSKNPSNLYEGIQNVIISDKTETQSNKFKHIQSNTYKYNNTDTKESTVKMAVETQQRIPSSQLEKTSTNNIPEKIKTENNVRFSEFGQMDTQQQQHQFLVDEAKIEQIDQNINQQWKQTEQLKDNETVWGQSLKSFLQMPQKQDEAETFGIRIKEDHQRTTTEIILAEKFKREPENLDDVYKSNYNNPAQIQTTGASYHNMQDIQTPQMVNTEVLIEPTTSKPGFWKSAKNKFVSWFKKS